MPEDLNVTANVAAAELAVKLGDVIDLAIEQAASDIHFGAGAQLSLRINGVLTSVDSLAVLSQVQAEQLLFTMLTEDERNTLMTRKELDFSYQHDDGTMLRGNAYFRNGMIACVLRLISRSVRSTAELGLPEVIQNFSDLKSGLVIITGPTGSGKSTTLAAILEEINQKHKKHIVTIEDPIEFLFTNKESVFSQREVGVDTHSYEAALRSAFREDPDVLVLSELRSPEEIDVALTLAETGHLVFATMHTWNAGATIARLSASFPDDQRSMVLSRIADVMVAAISQRLVLSSDATAMLPITEILINTERASAAIRSGSIDQLNTIMQTGAAESMMTMESSLKLLYESGLIDSESASQLHPRSDL